MKYVNHWCHLKIVSQLQIGECYICSTMHAMESFTRWLKQPLLPTSTRSCILWKGRGTLRSHSSIPFDKQNCAFLIWQEKPNPQTWRVKSSTAQVQLAAPGPALNSVSVRFQPYKPEVTPQILKRKTKKRKLHLSKCYAMYKANTWVWDVYYIWLKVC